MLLPDYGALGAPTCGYVSVDGRTITDWHGQFMGRVVAGTPVRLPQPSWLHGNSMTSYIVNINGCRYHGRSSRGVLINLYPYKDQ